MILVGIQISFILELKNLEDKLSGKHMCVSLSRIFIHECGNFFSEKGHGNSMVRSTVK